MPRGAILGVLAGYFDRLSGSDPDERLQVECRGTQSARMSAGSSAAAISLVLRRWSVSGHWQRVRDRTGPL